MLLCHRKTCLLISNFQFFSNIQLCTQHCFQMSKTQLPLYVLSTTYQPHTRRSSFSNRENAKLKFTKYTRKHQKSPSHEHAFTIVYQSIKEQRGRNELKQIKSLKELQRHHIRSIELCNETPTMLIESISTIKVLLMPTYIHTHTGYRAPNYNTCVEKNAKNIRRKQTTGIHSRVLD